MVFAGVPVVESPSPPVESCQLISSQEHHRTLQILFLTSTKVLVRLEQKSGLELSPVGGITFHVSAYPSGYIETFDRDT